MRMSRAKKETVILNKVKGNFYVIKDVHKDESGKIIFAEAFPVAVSIFLESIGKKYKISTMGHIFVEEELRAATHELPYTTNDPVTLNEANAICFRVIKDSIEDLTTENWYIQDGYLMRNGKRAAEQGEKEVAKILKIFPEKILLAIKTDKKDYFQLRYFAPTFSGKTFQVVLGDKKIPMPQKVTLTDGETLLYYSKTHFEETAEGEKKTSKETVDASGYLIYDSVGAMIDHNEYDTFSDGPLGNYVTATDNFIVFQGIFNGKRYTNILEHGELYSIELNSPITVATESIGHLLMKSDDELAVMSMEEIPLMLKASKKMSRVLKELQGYDYIVDYKNYTAAYKDEEICFSLTLATKDYDVKKLKGSYTADIGLVLSLE